MRIMLFYISNCCYSPWVHLISKKQLEHYSAKCECKEEYYGVDLEPYAFTRLVYKEHLSKVQERSGYFCKLVCNGSCKGH